MVKEDDWCLNTNPRPSFLATVLAKWRDAISTQQSVIAVAGSIAAPILPITSSELNRGSDRRFNV
jgi:hypothetical protein